MLYGFASSAVSGQAAGAAIRCPQVSNGVRTPQLPSGARTGLGGSVPIRVGFPRDLRVMPSLASATVLSPSVVGTASIRPGSRPPGSVVLPAGTAHFHWAQAGESVVQIAGLGPTATNYVDREDDPRRVHRGGRAS